MTSNIKELDPVQGLVDYIEDIKPYHSKVIEILTEYVYNEAIDVTMTDSLHLQIDMVYPGPIDFQETFDILCGFGQQPYDGFTSWPVIVKNITFAAGPALNPIGGPFFDPLEPTKPLGYDPVAGTIVIPGDRTGQYIVGEDIIVDLYAFDTALDTRTPGVQTQYTIVDSLFSSFGQTNGVADTPHTTLTVVGLVDPGTLPPLGPNEVYAAGVNLVGFTIDSVVGYSNAAPVFYTDVPPGPDPLPTPTVGSLSQTPDENPGAMVFSNSFVFVGNVESVFSQGFRFDVVGGTTEGQYTVLYSHYDSVSGNTYVRVMEHVPTAGFVTGVANERFFGYDNICVDQANIPVGLTSTEFVEGFVLSWSDPAETDVIDGYQYFIKDATAGGAGPLVPYSLMSYLNDGSGFDEEGTVFAFEVTTGGSFRIGTVIMDFWAPSFTNSDNVMSVYDQSGTAIAPTANAFVYGDGTTVDNTFATGVECAEYILTPGIYQVMTQAYDIDDRVGAVNILVAPTDGIGMPIGGPAGVPTAVHTGVRYVGKVPHNDSSTSIGGEVPALGALPALETDLQNRHSAAGWMDGAGNDGHLFQFEVGPTDDYFIVGVQTGDIDPFGVVAPIPGTDLGFTIYDATGAVYFGPIDNEFSEYAEQLYDYFEAGVYQIHVFAPAGVEPSSPFSVYIMDAVHGLERSVDGDDFATGTLLSGLQYDRQLAANLTPGPASVLGSGSTTLTVNGDATGDILNGAVFQVIGSPSNDGLYTVSAPPTFDGQFTDITVVEPLTTEKGGWAEKYVP
jgi:hypothetical protein